MLEIFTDGSSLGNPGDSGIGVVVYKDRQVLKKRSLYIGKATNNFAEYMALIVALQQALALGDRPVSVYMDSELVANQVTGRYKVRNSTLYPLCLLAKNLVELIGQCSILHKHRQYNKTADSLARKAAKLRCSSI